jgi:hypothetical protein
VWCIDHKARSMNSDCMTDHQPARV